MSDSNTATATIERPRFTRGDEAHRYSHEAHKVGPHSRPHTLAKVDGRTKEGTVLNRVREDLTNHIGHPNIVQQMLIERCAWLSVRIAMLDRKIEKGEAFTQVDSNTYLAWHNSLVRTLARLGIKRPDASSTPAPLTRVLDELDDDTA
jgi:hypothetical protein